MIPYKVNIPIGLLETEDRAWCENEKRQTRNIGPIANHRLDPFSLQNLIVVFGACPT